VHADEGRGVGSRREPADERGLNIESVFGRKAVSDRSGWRSGRLRMGVTFVFVLLGYNIISGILNII